MHASKRHIYGLILTLTFISISLFLYRHIQLGVPLTSHERIDSWTIEANLRFNATSNMPVKASFSIPYMPPHFAILDEYFVSRHYGVTTNLVDNNRRAIWSLRRSKGSQSLYYRAIFREADNMDASLSVPKPTTAPHLSENAQTAAETIISEARESSADIQTFAQSTILALNQQDGNAKLLVGPMFSDLNVAKATIAVLQQAKIRALLVEGIELKSQLKAELKPYLAVYNEKEWHYMNPRNGTLGLPKNFLIWHYGDSPLFTVKGGKMPQFTLTVSPTPINALSAIKVRGSKVESQLLRFSLLQLPVNAQDAYKVILTIPVGALMILIMRNFIGLSTFGTFMPVLIALAFRETHLAWGLVLFSFIVACGLLVRFYLDQLRLLIVPRLVVILSVVILFMLSISVLAENLGISAGLSVALFPMVILTMTIERMCVTWDERGPRHAISAGGGSLIAASLIYGVINYPPLQYLLFAFPELLLLLMAVTLWLGQYKGYRLSELIRFQSLIGK